MTKTALIIGAGPAGLTLAYELAKATKEGKADIKPIVLEKSGVIGGISQTAEFNGNRIDIGGHRFFSKSDTVMKWWNEILPVEKTDESNAFLEKYPNSVEGAEVDPEKTDDVLLVRNRLSRIYYQRKFFDYPVSLSLDTIKNLGFSKMMKIGFSYLGSKFHKEDESNLEGFYINRFGRELYNTFFRDYTAKLWGVSPAEIDSSWGAQRVKGLSVAKVLANAVTSAVKPKEKVDITQKDVETSLIEAFLYPKLGPGYMWETVAKKIQEMGGEILMQSEVTKVNSNSDNNKDGNLKGISYINPAGEEKTLEGDYVISTLPVNELVESMGKGGVDVPEDVNRIASGLPFRDFITVGILADELKIKNETERVTVNGIVPDNWIYIQEPDVTVCRLQVFNNWSPYLVKDQNKTWIGMEYVVSEKDDIWKLSDEEMSKFGVSELEKIGIIDPEKVNETHVIHLKKTYPAYFGTYPEFDTVKNWTLGFDNLYLLGRNGQHRYNNMDHSMLTAINAAQNIINDVHDKTNIWEVNTEQEYHESK